MERARQDLAARYAMQSGEPTVAYLWARTARDPRTAGRIPLLKTFWLCKKRGKGIALLPIPMADGSGVTFRLIREADLENPQRIIDEHPHLQGWEVTADSLRDFFKNGTMNRAGVWSPCSGRPGVVALGMEDLRRQGQQGLLGAQMTAVVVETTLPGRKKTMKQYRLPTAGELLASEMEREDLETAFDGIPYGVPDEDLPPPGTLGFRIPLYGYKKWREVFTPRQLFSLAIFTKQTREAMNQLKSLDGDCAEAVGAMLAVSLSRLVGMSTSFCRWESKSEFVCQIYARFALPMLWDFAEINPLSATTGNYLGGVDWVARFVEHASFKASVADVVRRSAKRSLQSGSLSLCMTEPPYYDAIPYLTSWIYSVYGCGAASPEATRSGMMRLRKRVI